MFGGMMSFMMHQTWLQIWPDAHRISFFHRCHLLFAPPSAESVWCNMAFNTASLHGHKRTHAHKQGFDPKMQSNTAGKLGESCGTTKRNETNWGELADWVLWDTKSKWTYPLSVCLSVCLFGINGGRRVAKTKWGMMTVSQGHSSVPSGRVAVWQEVALDGMRGVEAKVWRGVREECYETLLWK